MNEVKKVEQLQTISPQYVTNNMGEDEIDLIDIWITLRQYKKVFLWVFITIFLLGLVKAMFFFQEKYTLTSVIQIGSINNGNSITAIESPESLIGKLNNALIPEITNSLLIENSSLSKFDTNVSSPKNSDIVLLQNTVKESDIDIFSEYQKKLAAFVLSDHKQKITFAQSDLLAEMSSAQAKLKNLQDPKALMTKLDFLRVKLTSEEQKLKRMEESYQSLLKGGKEAVLQSLIEEKGVFQSLSESNDSAQQISDKEKEKEKEKEKMAQLDKEVDGNVLQTRYDRVLLVSLIQQDEQHKTLELAKLELNEIELEHQREVEDQQREVVKIQQQMDAFNFTRLLSEPVRSLNSTQLSRTKMIIIVIFIAAFIGFLAMLIAMFRDKVNQRLQENL